MHSTLFDKLWNAHQMDVLRDGRTMLFVDRHIVHDVSSPQAFSDLSNRKMSVAYPELTFATADHIVSTEVFRDDNTVVGGKEMIQALREATQIHDIKFLDIDHLDQGIVHVCFPEQGTILPGTSVCCGDSHTCTLGALGALAFAVGTSEITQVLATQTVFRMKPKTMRIWLTGEFKKHIYAKDLALHMVGEIGSNGARGFAVEFAGPLVESLSIEERFTLCNMASETGAMTALIAPDEKTFAYLDGLPMAPKGDDFRLATNEWKHFYSGKYSKFDAECVFDISDLKPQITWGTSPDQVMSVCGTVPSSEGIDDASKVKFDERSRSYMAVDVGQSLIDTPIDTVFIGSCTNARISDLRIAAKIVAGGYVAKSIRAIVVPGSSRVRRQAESEGLDSVFKNAGFEWRRSGCSMCAALNPDRMDPSKRCISTSNRNYEGRQGPGSRTHLVSPATAAACAIAGKIVDVRRVVSE